MTVGVCTIVKGRRAHLVNQMKGLARQTHGPNAYSIAYMQRAAHEDLPALTCEVTTRHVISSPLPLAAARNVAARALDTDAIIFLDVDCIPSDELVSIYANTVAQTGACVMGPTRYLGPEADDTRENFGALWQRATVHPARRDPSKPEGSISVQLPMQELWGLCFSMPRQLFEDVGGFDEAFDGYGGEETDFARRLADHGASLIYEPAARAVHQWHAVHVPPLQHFDDIVRNARRFRETHGEWCMEYWLGQLADAGYVEWSEEAETLDVVRRPSAAAISAARQPSTVLYS